MDFGIAVVATIGQLSRLTTMRGIRIGAASVLDSTPPHGTKHVGGEIRTRPLGTRIAELLITNGGSRRNVKWRLMRAGLLRNRCDVCGINEWLGKPLAVHF